MLGFLSFFILFIRPIFSAILTVIGLESASGQMGILYAIASVFAYLYVVKTILKDDRGRISHSFMRTVIIAGLLLVAIGITFLQQGTREESIAALKSFGSATICAMILANRMANNDRSLSDFCKWIPVFILILTVMSFVSVLFGKTNDSGLSFGQNGIGYQNGAYYAAYSFGLNLFYISEYKALERFRWTEKIKPVFYITLFLQVATVIYSGGRGGLALMIVISLYFVIINRRKFLKAKYFMIAMCVLLLAIVSVVIFVNANSDVAGVNRILRFLSNISDSGRDELKMLAIDAFKRSPILGHGINSVWYQVGYYSHNIFTDILVETGIVGTSAVVACLIAYFVWQKRAVEADARNRVIFVLFLLGFVMLLFSGYYLNEPFSWFAVVYMYTYRLKLKRTKHLRYSYYPRTGI